MTFLKNFILSFLWVCACSSETKCFQRMAASHNACYQSTYQTIPEFGMGCIHALLTEKSRASKQSTCNACFLLVEETTFSILASSFSLSVCTRVYFLIFLRSRGRRVQCCMGAMSKSESLSLLHRGSCSHRYKQY